jgi:hypothetical protein
MEGNNLSRRAAGVGFCFIAAFLFASRYISAAIYGSNVSTWSSDWFVQYLKYIGNALTYLSIVSLIIGIVYLLLAEIKK